MKPFRTLSLLLFFASSYVSSSAQQLDNRIVSMFIINFTKYIEWPVNVKDEFVIGISGNKLLATELQKMMGNRKVNNKSVIIKEFTVAAANEAKNCQILIFGETAINQIKALAPALAGNPVLIITEKDFNIKKNVGINILLDEEDDFKTKFQLNKATIESSGLKVSSSLIGLSKQ